MLAQLSPIDKVSIVALGQKIAAEEQTATISGLAARLAVPLMSESRNRRDLVARLATPVLKTAPETPAGLGPAQALIEFLAKRSGAVVPHAERQAYAPWFKDFLADLHAKGTTWPELGRLTGISVDTLEGFAASGRPLLVKEKMGPEHEALARIWQAAAPHHRKSLDHFFLHLSRRHRELAVTYGEMRQLLIELGLHAPRGPRIANHGAQVKRPFAPHAIWEGDGKQIKITVNGVDFIYHWYAFVDQHTTLLVGSTVGTTESAAEFLAALEDGGRLQGTYPIGVLIDNRLEGSDLGPIRDFCAAHRIALVRIFPGSSKTNGNIENNFSIFERQVGSLQINATTPAEIAKGLVACLVEVFTQQRNHRPRGRLAGKTPAEVAASKKRPEEARDAIERMARRFERENRQIDEKWELIQRAREHFGTLELASVLKIKGELGKYPIADIVAAQAAYVAQIVKHPDRRYGPEYFLAILRHKREGRAKSVYNEAYRAGVALARGLFPVLTASPTALAPAIVDVLLEIQDEPTPAHQMLQLDALCWWLVGAGCRQPLAALWQLVGDVAERTLAMTLRWWEAINEYVTDRLGERLHLTSPAGVAAKA